VPDLVTGLAEPLPPAELSPLTRRLNTDLITSIWDDALEAPPPCSQLYGYDRDTPETRHILQSLFLAT
jgi:hypothetical protein